MATRGQKVIEQPKNLIHLFTGELGYLNRILAEFGMSDPLARLFIRTIFSVLDGYCYHVKQLALEEASLKGISLSDDDLEVIKEIRTKRKPDGSTTEVAKIIQTKDNLKFAITIYARVREVESPLPQGLLPESFHIASAVRNRVTHPKRVEDFDVVEVERQAVAQLIIWFGEIAKWVTAQQLQGFDESRERIRKKSDEAIQRLNQLRKGPAA